MSPLIATVLLIAFAVALGTMIMNWSAGMEPGVDLPTLQCNSVFLTTTSNICYSSNALQLVLQNNGAAKIDSVSVQVVSLPQDIDMTLKVKHSSIIPGETIERSLPLLYPGDDVTIEVTPMVLIDGILKACDKEGFIQQKLIDC